MGIKKLFIILGMTSVFSNCISANELSLENVAKALELVIVDLKKQKDENRLYVISKDNNLSAITTEILLLKEQISKLQKENQKITLKYDHIQKKLNELTFSIEDKSLTEPVIDSQKKSQASVNYLKTTAHLRVHSKPFLESQTISYLPKGAIVEALEIRNDLVLTQLGWVSKNYLTSTSKD